MDRYRRFESTGLVEDNIVEIQSKRPENMLGLVWKYFSRHKLALAGGIVLILLILGCALGPLISPYDLEKSNLPIRYQSPSLYHLFGTDDLGRDILTRLLYGGRISMAIGLSSMLISVVIGVTIGSLSGYYGGGLDNILMRLTDLMLTIPRLFLLILVSVILRGIEWPYLQKTGGIIAITLVLGIFSWMRTARLVRGVFLSLREKEFVVAARSLGSSPARIIVRHILPNALSPVIVAATLGVAGAIISESGLSYLGFGIQPPMPSWGNMLRNAQDEMMRGHIWMALFPGLIIFITVLSINYLGDGLRDALDPTHIE